MNVRIPPQIQGMPVVAIGIDAFRGGGLTSVTIPNGVTHIGSGAFSSCRNIGNNKLASVIIPDSVVYIGRWAFASNHLSSVVIPDSVTHIGDEAF